ncbi:DUF4296 domain-containing protein [Robiginitalea sp.]|uniref:DUF4296 domain-containing protein n=2 Tax=Robiginitalea sp. TaxID=1902411 RepID=UPI003C77EDB4
MINRFFCIGICFLVLSCGNQLMEAPEDLISKEKMSDILYDITLINSIDNSHPQVLKSKNIKVMDFVFKKYGIDSTQFVQSDLYYASVPALYEEIYQAVEDRLERARDSTSKLIQDNRTKDGDTLDPLEDYD